MRSLLVLLVACSTAHADTPPKPAETPPPAMPAWRTPQTPPAIPRETKGALLITNAKIHTLAGAPIDKGFVLVENGRISAVGAGDRSVAGARVIDANGRVVTPGIIDTHSHMGVYPSPYVDAHEDGNEMTDPVTADVWAEHAFWPQDPDLRRALAGGVTTIQVLPGSANLIGGRSFTAKLHVAESARPLRVAAAPQGLKMACGENPKRVYGGEKKRAPMTRMGNIAGFRREFQRASEYRRRWQKYERDLAAWEKREHKAKDGKPDDPPDPPDRNLSLETLAAVLDGKILVHNHCYRADEMHAMLDLAKEFGFKIRSFHHALEAYKLRDRLAKEDVAVSTWADWWGFKMEAFDGVRENAALVHAAGARAIIHSDSAGDVRHLQLEAAKAMAAGRKIGLTLSDDDALSWVTKNPAWALGLENELGTLEKGKAADLVLWDGSPLSVYTHADVVVIDGEIAFDRSAPPRVSDFELGGAR